jgi:hypothetical protein
MGNQTALNVARTLFDHIHKSVVVSLTDRILAHHSRPTPYSGRPFTESDRCLGRHNFYPCCCGVIERGLTHLPGTVMDQPIRSLDFYTRVSSSMSQNPIIANLQLPTILSSV